MPATIPSTEPTTMTTPIYDPFVLLTNNPTAAPTNQFAADSPDYTACRSSVNQHELRPLTNRKRMCTSTPAAASPLYNIIEPDNEHCDCPMPWFSTPPCCSTRIINMHLPSNISIQAMHHIMNLEAIKVATDSQWT
jgi:hypothetical protein